MVEGTKCQKGVKRRLDKTCTRNITLNEACRKMDSLNIYEARQLTSDARRWTSEARRLTAVYGMPADVNEPSSTGRSPQAGINFITQSLLMDN